MFDWGHGIALTTIQGNWASSAARGKFHGFSRVAAGTWGIFLSYSGDHPSMPMFVQRHQDSCLVTRRPQESP